MYKAKAYSAARATSPLASSTIPLRDLGQKDVQIEILFCGVCHSDLHTARNEWSEFQPTVYPVPGHKIDALPRPAQQWHRQHRQNAGNARLLREHNRTSDMEV
jgi:hypothetical protein